MKAAPTEPPLPEPLVAAEVDLSGFPSFLFKYERFLASELVALATAEEGWAALMLWTRSFQQKPPGSLPDDDRVLAAFSRAGTRWPKVRSMALRGFVKCSDGRLYNRTMSEVVNEAWASRIEHRETAEAKSERQKRWRERQSELSTMLREYGVTPPKGASLATLEGLLKDASEASHVDDARRNVDVYSDVSVDAGEMPKKEKGRRREGLDPSREGKVQLGDSFPDRSPVRLGTAGDGYGSAGRPPADRNRGWDDDDLNADFGGADAA